MGLFRSRSIIEQLDDLLDQERAAVLGGDFDALTKLIAKKERAIAELSRLPQPPESLPSIQRKAERNRHLLASAGRGISAASDFLKKLKQPGDPLQTYDQSGSLRTHPSGGSSTQRRA